ncbi:hypothetical protein [Streptomyces sp. NBC_01803]|uniref:hypothetical protein n=1 Tax=Streptomyces sp. NBC_01803 TaxID=2975946 RepID=UPI002DD9AC82|nr:hypothetical protein [Streptomyces sp. NBC_01803]WSA44981.1 hypothetical protein OIE51_12625 [Streptomyces sp. NBC_01803]
MPWPYRPGEPILAEELNTALGKRVELIADSAGVTSSIALVTTGLAVPIAANAQYDFRVRVAYSSSQAGGARFAWTVPSGAAMSRHVLGVTDGQSAASGTVVMRARDIGTEQLVGGGLTFGSYWEDVRVVTAGTTGNCTLMYAQANSNATATIIRALSFVEYRRVNPA